MGATSRAIWTLPLIRRESALKIWHRVIFCIITVLLMGNALAHTNLSSSIPSDGSTTSAPSEIVLEFSDAVRLTSIALKGGSGDSVALGKRPSGPAKVFRVKIEGSVTPGDYVVSWRSISSDSHVVSGEIRFTVENRIAGDAV